MAGDNIFGAAGQPKAVVPRQYAVPWFAAKPTRDPTYFALCGLDSGFTRVAALKFRCLSGVWGSTIFAPLTLFGTHFIVAFLYSVEPNSPEISRRKS
jgi:hypothetical protein